MDVDFELCQQLQGHTSQVRCIAVLGDGTLVTGGLDAKVIMWRRSEGSGPFAMHKTLHHHSETIYSVGASTANVGRFYTGSKDKMAFCVDAEGNPAMQFSGHEGAISSVVERGAQLITGAWDGKAKVWDISTGECKHTLEAGAHAVTVAVLPTGEIVTGSQDRCLRIFRGVECVHKVEEAHGDIIRGISTCSAHLITASNDLTLKMWSFDGCEMTTLSGHQNFVYGVTHSPDSQSIYSSSDDCTLKVWSVADMQCKQSLLHANTVWQGAGMSNGDLVTACGDSIVRIWTREPDRMAPQAERDTQREMAEQAALAAASKGSSSTSVESKDISEMPTTIGKKNGEIKCFKDGGTVFAFQWNAGARQWDKIGEVMGQDSQQEKKFYAGDQYFAQGQYDWVFDVDMGPAHGMRLLPFNRGDNPMQAAETFCRRENIDHSNQDQIRKFIMQNTGGTDTVGASSAPSSAPAAAPAQPEASVFPVMSPMSFKDGKYDPMQAKILEFNGQVDASLQLSEQEVQYLKDAIAKLKTGNLRAEFRSCEKDVINIKLKEWPQDKMMPVIDLWRLWLVHPASADLYKGPDRGASYIAQVAALLSSDPNGGLGLCSARYLANLFLFQTNKYSLYDRRSLVFKALEGSINSTNKHTKVASATLLLNFAVVLHESSQPPKKWDSESATTITRLALEFLNKASPEDADASTRALYAIGTLLPRDHQNGAAITKMCKDAGLPNKLGPLEQSRASAAAELRTLLNSRN